MNRILLTCFAVFFLKSYIPAEAQETNVIITISNKSFPERSDWGESVRIVSLTVYINGYSIGSLGSSQLSSPDNSVLSFKIPLNDSTVYPEFKIHYIHHTWNLFGDHSYDRFASYSLDPQNLDQYGISWEKIFTEFTGLEMLVDWHLIYKVEISPFKPVVNPGEVKKCYNTPFYLTLNPNSPVFYTRTGVLYNWEYGEVTTEPEENPEFFNVFLNGIVNNLEYQNSANFNIIYAVQNTNYNFMLEYLTLYDGLPDSKGSLIYALMSGIMDNNPLLTSEDRVSLYTYFPEAVSAQSGFPPPYTLVSKIRNWITLVTGKNETDPVEFDPKRFLVPEITNKTKIGFRARAINTVTGQYSPWSDEERVDILPAPPTGIINSSTKSCLYKETGEITLNVISPVNTLDYTYWIVDSGTCKDRHDISTSFTGSVLSIASIGYGSHVLCLDYYDPDLQNCAVEKDFYIYSLPVLDFRVTQKDVSCPGGNDGEIKVELSKWAGSFSITANGSTVTSLPCSFDGLTKNSYPLTVTDNCITDSRSIEIEEPEQVVINSVTLRNPTCITNSKGFGIIVSGIKNGIYDYRIINSSGAIIKSEPAIGPVWSYYSLPGGIYTINVRDHAEPECAGVSTTVDLRAGTPLSLTVTNIKDVLCFGQNKGEIEVTASGGTGSYKFNIGSDVLTDNPATFNSLLAGNYTVYAHNSDQTCNDVASVDVTVGTNPKIDISLIPVDVTCYGEGNGQINTVIRGGIPDYTNDWEIKENTEWKIYSNSAFLNGLDPGEYRLKVTDSGDCSSYDSTTINEPGYLFIKTVVPNDVICYGGKGSIAINVEGGNGGYSFSYYENGGDSYENLSSEFPLPAGTYKLKVTDSKGCETRWEEENVDKEVTITEPSVALDFTTTLSDYNGFNISCYGNSSGSLSVVATGGNDYGYNGYTYSLSGWPDQTSGVFTNLTAGIYNINVTDGRECLSSKTVTLDEPDPLLLSVNSIEQVKCFGAATGKIMVEAEGGTGPSYKYQLDEIDPVFSGVFSDLYAGTYKIEVMDLNGCKQGLFATVAHKNSLIQTIIIPQDVRCFGENNGEIAASVTGGSGGFDIKWEKMLNGSWQTTGENVANPDQLGPGNYRLKVADSDNCSVKDSTTVKEPDLLSITKVDLHDIICYGETGSIDMQTGGGNPGYKYFYSENNGTTFTEFTSLSSFTAATYKLKVSDSKGCETIRPEKLTITRPDESLDLTYIAKDYNGYSVSCFGNNDGHLTLKPSGGNGANYHGYSYMLSGGPSQSENVFASLTAGAYDISITDGRGCKVTKQVILTQAISELFLNASSIEQATCIDNANGRITLAASGGRSPYTYSSGNNAFVSGNEFTSLKVSNYHFTVKDVNGCAQIFDTSIVNTVPKMDITGTISEAKCFGQNSGTINVNISGGAMPFTYRWKDNSSVNAYIDNLYKGYYTLSVTDAAGCKAEQMFEIHEPDLPLSVTAISQPACVLTPNGTITPAAVGGTPPYLFAVDNQSRMYNNSLFLIYSGRHKVFAADANNCRAETEITVNERNTMPFVNFMLATSRYERDTLVVIDVSVPKPNNVTWGFSPEALVIATNPFDAKIKYNVTGIYPVKMTGHFETCDYSVEKLLNIAPYDPLVTGKDKYLTGIESVKITPNPNDGQFKVKVKLYTKQQIHIKILDYYSKIWHSSRYPAGIDFEQDINISGVLPGTYVLWIVSDNDSKALLFVISQ